MKKILSINQVIHAIFYLKYFTNFAREKYFSSMWQELFRLALGATEKFKIPQDVGISPMKKHFLEEIEKLKDQINVFLPENLP